MAGRRVPVTPIDMRKSPMIGARALRGMVRRLPEYLPRLNMALRFVARAGGDPVCFLTRMLIVAALICGVCACGPSGGKRPPNVILISIDTLRPDRMGVYGHRPRGVSTTPFLDELATRGAVFEFAVSTSSWTLPGHYALFSGLPDELHDMVDDRVPPPADIPLMAAVLRGEGYATAGFFSGPYLHPFFGFGRGFDTYESCLSFDTVYDHDRQELQALAPNEVAEITGRTERFSHQAITSPEVTRRALRFVGDLDRHNPFFLFLHYFDVHHDYTPPPPFDTRFGAPYQGWVDGRGVMSDPRVGPEMASHDLERLKALYDGEVAWVDENLRRLFRGLERLDPKLLENTLVVVTSDHGEEFFEHGRIGHRHNLYDGAVRIPLIFVLPGRVPRDRRIAEPARIYDILPSVLELAGLPAPDLGFGRSLVPAMSGATHGGATGGKVGEDAAALLELTTLPRGAGSIGGSKTNDEPRSGGTGLGEQSFTKQFALRVERFKLITCQRRKWSPERPLDFTGALLDERHEIYDLENDPQERRNLFDERPDLFQRLDGVRRLIFDRMREVYRARHRSPGDTGTPLREVPEKIKKDLEGIGY